MSSLSSVALLIFFVAISSIFHISSASQVDTFQKCLAHRSIPASLWVTPESNSTHYAFLNQPWNTRKAPVTPLGYFLPKSTPHVQHAVQCGVLAGMKVIPNSGGHSYEAISWGDNSTAIIDFRDMTRISLIPGRDGQPPIANLQPGAMVGPINSRLWQLGKVAIPMGNCMTVGIGGHAIGGGIGFFTPTYGVATDNLVEVEMVDAAGIAVTATRYQNPDLFWALRGSGPGYMGIVTNVKVRTFRADEAKFTFVKTAYRIKDFVKVASAFQEWLDWARKHEPGVSSSLFMMDDNWDSLYPVSPKGGVIVDLFHVYDLSRNQRGSNATFLAKLDEIFPQGGDRVITFPSYMEFVHATGYAPVKFPPKNSANHPSQIQEDEDSDERLRVVGWPSHSWPAAPTFPKEKDIIKKFDMMRKEYAVPRYFKAKSHYVKRKLTEEELTRLGQVLVTIPHNRCWVMINSEVGDVSKHSKGAAAFVHRDSIVNFVVHLEAVPSDGDVAEGMAWLEKFWTAMQSFDGGETYQNYPDLDVKDYLRRHYGSNVDRLVRLKREWDPFNYFTSALSIPVSA